MKVEVRYGGISILAKELPVNVLIPIHDHLQPGGKIALTITATGSRDCADDHKKRGIPVVSA